MSQTRSSLIPLATALLVVLGCEAGGTNPTPRSLARLRLATTTSVRDSGLLDVILPDFEQQQGCRVDVVAVGSGAALQLGRAGDAHVLLVHSPADEQEFMKQGYGIRRDTIMSNYFSLVGPPSDPASVRGQDPIQALTAIKRASAKFISRGDESGTHVREQQLWKAAGLQPDWPGYLEIGQGMGPTLMMADELSAYTLTDMGTYLGFRDKVRLETFSDESDLLKNTYSLIVAAGGQRGELSEGLVQYLLSPACQKKIGEYTINGQPLFTPIVDVAPVAGND